MSTHHAVPIRHGETAPQNPLLNVPAKGVSYFTPAQIPPAGTAVDPQPDGKPIPKLFRPLKLRGLTLQNRIMLSPLCQYSCDDGHMTDWHVAHLGGILTRGPGLSFTEATAVTAEGRITPQDSGIWKDSQIAPLKRIVDLAHSQGQKIAIQLAHAGRKSSTVAPWIAKAGVSTEEIGGWPDKVYGPSAHAYDEHHPNPKAMTHDDIASLKASWLAAVKRALTAGFDVIEIHNAHGYLLHSFISPVSNKRTDQYGGSFENRVRLTLEIVDLTRQNIPEDMPLFLRISASDWLDTNPEWKDESWTIADSCRLAKLLAARGVDLIDVSSGGSHAMQKIKSGPGYQAPFSQEIKKAVGETMAVGVVGTIASGIQANDLLEGKESGVELDLAVAGRMFQKNPGLVWAWADELEIKVQSAVQIQWGFGGRASVPKKHYE